MANHTAVSADPQERIDLADPTALKRLFEYIDKLPAEDRAIVYRECLLNFIQRTLESVAEL